MVSRIVLSILVGVVVAFVVYVVGELLIPITTLGNILVNISYAAGVVAGIWYFFAGSTGRPLNM